MRFLARENRRASNRAEGRFKILMIFFALLFAIMIFRLFYLQILQYGFYSLYASDQHELAAKLQPTRGQILVCDKADGALHPLATNRLTWQVYASPKDMDDPVSVAHALSSVLQVPDADIVVKLTRDPEDPYELIAKGVDSEAVKALKEQSLPGVGFLQSSSRLYPEKNIGGQLIGFVAYDEHGGLSGRYGIESSLDSLLGGTPGKLLAEKDAGGRRLAIGQTQIQEAKNGSDVILTIDRTIQFKACELISRAVERHNADGGSIVMMDPETGAIIAMCSTPDFDPMEFGKIKNLSELNNPVTFNAYEPGSVFKAFTMAAGLD